MICSITTYSSCGRKSSNCLVESIMTNWFVRKPKIYTWFLQGLEIECMFWSICWQELLVQLKQPDKAPVWVLRIVVVMNYFGFQFSTLETSRSILRNIFSVDKIGTFSWILNDLNLTGIRSKLTMLTATTQGK